MPQVQKHHQTAKHKKSDAKAARIKAKVERNNSMETEGVDRNMKSDAEIATEKRQRKMENAKKVDYKKKSSVLTGRNGPYAVTK